MDKEIKYGDALTKSDYASMVGVHPSRITHLIQLNKLLTTNVLGKQRVLHCEENELLFPKYLKRKES